MKSDARPNRYTAIPFPRRRYIPGQGVHPRRDPAGPHVPHVSSTVVFSPGTWAHSEPYLYAVDLFNYGYWWEAHEVLEDLWIESGKETQTGRFLQGIIQIAAALLKNSLAIRNGASRLAAKGLPKLRFESGIFLGVDIDEFGRDVERFLTEQERTPPTIVLQYSSRSDQIPNSCRR